MRNTQWPRGQGDQIALLRRIVGRNKKLGAKSPLTKETAELLLDRLAVVAALLEERKDSEKETKRLTKELHLALGTHSSQTAETEGTSRAAVIAAHKEAEAAQPLNPLASEIIGFDVYLSAKRSNKDDQDDDNDDDETSEDPSKDNTPNPSEE